MNNWCKCGGRVLVAIGLGLLAGCATRPYGETSAMLGMPGAAVTCSDTEVVIANGVHRFVFGRGKRPATIDGVCYYLHSAAGQNELNRQDAELLRKAVVNRPPRKAKLRVMLDAGHGAADTGCRVGDTYEKNITLAVTLEVKRLLEARGHTVLLTRSDDKPAPTLDERVALAANQRLDAFVSIHVNSAKNSAAKGVEVYTIPAPGCEGTAANSPARPPMVGQNYLVTATRLALAVQRALVKQMPAAEDRGVRHAHFKVLRDTPAPSILIEMGFLTNSLDFLPLSTPAGQQAFATAIADGILRAF